MTDTIQTPAVAVAPVAAAAGTHPVNTHALGVLAGALPVAQDPGGGSDTSSAELRGEAQPAGLVFTLIVHGTPGPQGSKSGRVAKNGVDVIMRESSKKVKPWRRAVADAARRALPSGWALLDEAIELEMTFTLHRGVTVRRPHPTVYPDLSKLARSTEDALTGIVWADDARIVRYRDLAKRYPLEGHDALNYPGVVVRVYRLTPPQHLSTSPTATSPGR